MKHNVFDKEETRETTLSHAVQGEILGLAKQNNVGSLRTALAIYGSLALTLLVAMTAGTLIAGVHLAGTDTADGGLADLLHDHVDLGDGRDAGDEMKISEDHIRSIWNDDDLYTIHYDVDVADRTG